MDLDTLMERRSDSNPELRSPPAPTHLKTGTPRTLTTLTTCFICGHDMSSDKLGRSSILTTWTTIRIEDLSKCLRKLFGLGLDPLDDDQHEDIFTKESFCTKCQELFETTSMIYEQLEKLDRELQENKRIVESQLKKTYTDNLQQITQNQESNGNNSALVNSIQSRVNLQKKLLNGPARAISTKIARRESSAPNHAKRGPCNCDCHSIMSPQDDETGGAIEIHTNPELIEIKVEPQEHSYEDEVGPTEVDSYIDGSDNADDNEADLEEEEGRFQRIVGDSIKLETEQHLHEPPRTRSRARLKPKKYSEFFEDSTSEVDPDPDSEAISDSNFESDQDSDFSDELQEELNSQKRGSPSKFRCDICNRCFQFASKFERHQKSHSNRKYICKICTKPCKTQTAAEKHEATHDPPPDDTGEKSFLCSLCPNKYVKAGGLRKHMANFHKTSKGRQKDHRGKFKKSGAGDKGYACGICGKTYKSLYDIKSHEESHKPNHERRNVCEVCGKGFFKASALTRHTKVKHTKEDTLYGHSLCPVCGKYVQQLKPHMKTHTGEKSYKCTVCDRSFGTNESARVHERIHTGEKPFECATCGMRFRTAQAHRRHAGVHMNKKSFICDHCGKAFRLRQSLREHLHVHTKELPHRCNLCGRRFADMDLMNRHMNVDHTAEQIERKKQNVRRRKDEIMPEAGGVAPINFRLSHNFGLPPMATTPIGMRHHTSLLQSPASPGSSSSSVPSCPGPARIFYPP